jgi:hypothetical protein
MPSYKYAVTICALLLLTLVPQESVSAQSEEQKIEVGVQFSVAGRRNPRIGGGGRLTFDLTKHLALEGELNYFPSAGFNNVSSFQGQFGVKSGLRFDRFGVFGKVRPGFIDSKSRFTTCLPCPPGVACAQVCLPVEFSDGATAFSLDVGGVVEFYPAKRITVRFDAGDTIVNRRESAIAFPLGNVLVAVPSPNFTTHNLQLGAGVGFRF